MFYRRRESTKDETPQDNYPFHRLGGFLPIVLKSCQHLRHISKCILAAHMSIKRPENRIIMSYGGEQSGPSLLVFAGLHGNEPAGIKALQLVHKMLEVEPITNPSFDFKGEIIGLIGNRAASEKNIRYIDEDLNRIWTEEKIAVIDNVSSSPLSSEETELKEILHYVRSYIKERRPKKLYILDLHTTSSDGGIFVIPTGDKESIKIASNLYSPVILGMMDGIQGTTLHYFKRSIFKDVETVSLTFEGGQHQDPKSINRCIAAIVNCLRSIGCVCNKDVENIHDQILIEYSESLPKVTRLIYKHHITRDDKFVMHSGFQNFDVITAGQELATDKSGPVLSPFDGRILMPLYQPQGEEGFYIVEVVD